MTKEFKRKFYEKEIEIRKLKHLVIRDELTGLFNRRGFFETVEKICKEISYQKKHPLRERKHFFIDELSVVFFDIDDFKKINDKYGHKLGDQILKFVSHVISERVRSIDMVARFGGEEIVVALVGSDEEDAYKKSEEIRKAMTSKIKIPGLKELKLTVSCGVAELTPKINLDELIRRADKSMYEAKIKRGKNNTVRYSEFKKKG